jgi:trans-2,3-dihydro-3-hydroxyanthranilate isomerase
MTPHTYFLLDVFTDQMFGGNQLAIFPDGQAIHPDLFQKIAAEFNLSETVFLFPSETEEEPLSMRIFTPTTELPTAGHPTIGTAHYLASRSEMIKSLTLNQKVGLIKVDIQYKDNEPSMITMQQPLPTFGKTYTNSAAIAEMISLKADDLDIYPIQEISCGNSFLFIPIKSAKLLAKAKIDSAKWEQLNAQFESKGIYVFSINDVEGGAVQGRMFAPALGITEDPATGSANGPLGCYLSKYTSCDFPIVSLQGFEMGRPSYLHLNIRKNENGDINKVEVGGQSVIIGTGELFLD